MTKIASARPIHQTDKRGLERASFTEARDAWFAGDFGWCLELCDRVAPRDVEATSELALLRARALLRLSRPDEARQAVVDAFVAHGTLDASLTAQMLLGAAYVRLGDVDRGVSILDAAEARSIDAHPSIRSEIALNQALACYARRDLEGAESALARVSRDSDIIHARALEFHAWIATARADYKGGADAFRATLLRLDRCKHRDRHVEATCIYGIATYAVESLDLEYWEIAEERARSFDWAATGLSFHRFWLYHHRSTMAEVSARVEEAYDLARAAEHLAPSEAFRVTALCRRAAIARSAGEPFATRTFLNEAVELYSRLDRSGWEGEEQLTPLILAEELAEAGDAAVLKANALLSTYRSNRLASGMLSLTGDPRLGALEAYLDGRLAATRGDIRAAITHCTSAFQTFSKIGYNRRAAIAALQLGALTGQSSFFDFASRAARAASPDSWLRRQVRHRERIQADELSQTLTPTEREVLILVCDGKSTRQIAAARGRSRFTIRNTISDLFGRFGVDSRPALIAECAKRKIVAPPEA
jgi:DNA-binding CsgD family transcriptional regulator